MSGKKKPEEPQSPAEKYSASAALQNFNAHLHYTKLQFVMCVFQDQTMLVNSSRREMC